MMAKMRKLHLWLGLVFLPPMLLVSVTGLLLVQRKALGLDEIMIKVPGYGGAKHADPQEIIIADGVTLAASKQGVFVRDGKSWELTLPQPVRRLYAAGGTLYACSRAGLYESADGRSWKEALPGEDVRAMLFPGGRAFAATTRGIFVKEAGSWKPEVSFPSGKLDVRNFTQAEGGFLVAAKEGVLSISRQGVSREELRAGKEGQVSLQKVITDLHTGEIFGRYFYLVVDAGAASIAGLCLSGFYFWYARRRKRAAV